MKVKPAERAGSVQEYYFSSKLRQIDEMRKAGIDVINLGIGSPDQPPSENTVRRLANEAAKPNVHGYQSYSGSPVLRKAFADWYRKYFNVVLDPATEIMPLIGSKEGIMHISMAFVDPGDEILVPDPGYPTYSSATRLAGGIVKPYDLNETGKWLPDIAKLEDSDLSRVRLMWINYPHMPSGAKANIRIFEKLVGFAMKHNILLCNDNPYSFILNNDHLSLLSVDGAREISIELNSLSKSHNMAGWRIGMAASNGEFISTVLRVKSNMDSGIFLPLQLAAAEALGNDGEWYLKVNRVYSERRIAAGEIFSVLGCTWDPGQSGMFLWGRLPESYGSCEEFSDNLLHSSAVFITPGFIFGNNGKRYIRISLCSSAELLIEAKQRIEEFRNKKDNNTINRFNSTL
ncbi:MAG TPA: aminotransferase class I/II-fold pyridoxal phosphate-dependent enzyme [Bacteroidales bacterium]|nr:aminotransferase class I/II-fold pyridoxal phosphate-dependent enzyme [Bacteroidales bacterium]